MGDEIQTKVYMDGEMRYKGVHKWKNEIQRYTWIGEMRYKGVVHRLGNEVQRCTGIGEMRYKGANGWG